MHNFKPGQAIKWDGDEWTILAVGAEFDRNGDYFEGCVLETVLLHLASNTRGKQQRNGWAPNQIAVAVPFTHPTIA